MNAPTFSLREALARAAVPLAALAAGLAFAGREPAPAAAEGVYLGVLACGVLLAAGFLAPPPAWELGLGAPLAVTVLWALPAGPGRGAAMGLLLAALFAVAAGRRLALCLPALPLATALPLALGAQLLLRGSLLFHPQLTLRTLVALLALPTAGAVALAVLSRRHGALALVAGATAVALAPGWNVAATLGLAALAAGELAARPELGRWGRGAALVALVAPIAWEPGPGIAAAVAGLALWRPRLALGLAVPAALGLAWYFHLGFTALPPTFWLLPLLVPAAAWPAPGRWAQALAALPLAAATPLRPDASALAAPLALAALAARREEALAPQGVWSGALLGGTALLASYPWLRGEAVGSALALLGITPGPRAALLVVFAFLLVSIAVREARWRPLVATAAAAIAVFAALAFALPPSGETLLPAETGVKLDAGHPLWTAALAPRPAASVVVDSSLANGAALADGTAVAIVQIIQVTQSVQPRPAGEQRVSWVLRAGEGTGEWAARRPDVERTARLRSPPAWLSWVAGDFFGQRYRRRWDVLPAGPQGSPAGGAVRELRIERLPALPADVELVLHQVEVRR